MKQSLQVFLDSVPEINPAAEHEIDLLRLILQGKCGTAAQRACLVRIIKQSRAGSKNFPLRLAQKMGDLEQSNFHGNRLTYITPAPRSKVQLAEDKHRAWLARCSVARQANDIVRQRLDMSNSEYNDIYCNLPRDRMIPFDTMQRDYRHYQRRQAEIHTRHIRTQAAARAPATLTGLARVRGAPINVIDPFAPTNPIINWGDLTYRNARDRRREARARRFGTPGAAAGIAPIVAANDELIHTTDTEDDDGI